jgi:hypothetical protein
VFVLDWHDADICGKAVLNKDTGRIFRIAPKRSLASDWPDRYGDLAKLDDAELVKLQLSESAWHARRARLILQGRAAAGKLAKQTGDDDAAGEFRGRARAVVDSLAKRVDDGKLRKIFLSSQAVREL